MSQGDNCMSCIYNETSVSFCCNVILPWLKTCYGLASSFVLHTNKQALKCSDISKAPLCVMLIAGARADNAGRNNLKNNTPLQGLKLRNVPMCFSSPGVQHQDWRAGEWTVGILQWNGCSAWILQDWSIHQSNA